MVSNIYTPLLRTVRPRGVANTPNNPNSQTMIPTGLQQINPDESRKSFYEPITPREKTNPVRIKGLSEKSLDQNEQDQGHSNGQMDTLLEQQQRGRISIQTVLKDFYKTLEAVSQDPDVQKTIKPYLDVVELQSQTEKPNMALMRENLKIAAKTLDQYITASLGSPSTVVKEWVDALLMQPLDFRQTNLPPNSVGGTNSTGQPKLPESFTTVLQSLDPDAIPDAPVSVSQKLNNAKKMFQDKNWDAAKMHLHEALDLITDETPDILQAHVLYGLGRLAEREIQNDLAIDYYQQAQDAFKQKNSAIAMQHKVALSLSQLYLSSGINSRSNQQYQLAFKSLKAALSNAKIAQDKNLAKQSLQHLAGLYLDTDMLEKAQVVLSKIGTLI